MKTLNGGSLRQPVKLGICPAETIQVAAINKFRKNGLGKKVCQGSSALGCSTVGYHYALSKTDEVHEKVVQSLSQ
jgi:hypothetical protein